MERNSKRKTRAAPKKYRNTGSEEMDLAREFETETVMPDSSGQSSGGNNSNATANRSNKPEIEKRRRQRINQSLNELKRIVLEALQKDASKYSKLEKADILEMTLRHVQALHRRHGLTAEVSSTRAQFRQCVLEVTRYLSSLHHLPDDVKHEVCQHLHSMVDKDNPSQMVATVLQCHSATVPLSQPILLLVNATGGLSAGAIQMVNVVNIHPGSHANTARQLPSETNCDIQQAGIDDSPPPLIPLNDINGNYVSPSSSQKNQQKDCLKSLEISNAYKCAEICEKRIRDETILPMPSKPPAEVAIDLKSSYAEKRTPKLLLPKGASNPAKLLIKSKMSIEDGIRKHNDDSPQKMWRPW